MSPIRSRQTSPSACAAARRAALYPFTNHRSMSQVQLAFTCIPRVLHRPVFPSRNKDLAVAMSKVTESSGKTSLEESVRMARGLPCVSFRYRPDDSSMEAMISPNSPKDVILPTHLLRLRSPSTSRTIQMAPLHFPIHSNVLASQCANVPPLPLPSSSNPVPLVEIEIPSPETFSIIHSHLYAHHIPGLMSDLLPINNKLLFAPGSPFDIPAIARICATSMTAADLLDCGKRIYGVYLNARMLGVRDDDLWKAISIAWTIFTGALTIHVGRRHSMP
ncbi:hypothetical protein FRC03_005420 [Tulasnella sp. 419]|nr:hypothetical protein FRC03_005420 [Tulasnella sp. 419]